MRVKPQGPEFGVDLPADPMERLVHFAALAPSWHNSQPWKFVLERDAIDVFADLSRWLRVADPERRELYLSLGCALESLLIAADYEGFGADARLFPVAGDDTYVCRVEIRRGGPKRGNAAADLLHAVPHRHTSHREFDHGHPVPERDLAWLRGVADGERLAFHLLGEDGARRALEALLARAEAKLLADPERRAELGRWIGSGALGTSWLSSKLEQLAVTRLAGARHFSQAEAARLFSAPHVALLSTRADAPADRVATGQAYLRIALMAETRGIRAQPFSAPLHLAEMRAEVARLYGIGERRPQHLFRLGYAEPEAARTRRRALSEILVRTG
jgi:nitroreductase